jgi:predicted transglutaminase-like cysteine proteinase
MNGRLTTWHRRTCVWIAAGIAAAALACMAPGRAQSRHDLGFTTAVSERLIAAYAARFGAPAREHLERWKAYARERKALPARELELLVLVNTYLNRLTFVEDIKHWGETDYWATPAEAVASNGADCEDYSIAKYFFLKELGIPAARLRLTYVKALKLDQAHMILAYYAHPGAEPLVLDNLEQTVRSASQRPDLVPVYSFNDDEVWIDARGTAGSPKQLRNWSSLLERLQREARM